MQAKSSLKTNGEEPSDFACLSKLVSHTDILRFLPAMELNFLDVVLRLSLIYVSIVIKNTMFPPKATNGIKHRNTKHRNINQQGVDSRHQNQNQSSSLFHPSTPDQLPVGVMEHVSSKTPLQCQCCRTEIRYRYSILGILETL